MAEARPRQWVIDLLLQDFPGSEKFIRSIVASLLDQGARVIQKSYRSIGKRIVEHTQKLENARQKAAEDREAVQIYPTPANIQRLREAEGLVRYYEKELQRFRAEYEILREAMDMLSIPVP